MLPLILAVITVMLAAILIFIDGIPARVNFLVRTQSNKLIEVSVSPRLNGMLKVQGVTEPYAVVPWAETNS
jgi:hypothetical protein